MVKILELKHKPEGNEPVPGFHLPVVNKGSELGYYPSDNSGNPLVVKDIEEVPEELQDKIQSVRHGFGIQIYSNGMGLTTGRYAGDWSFNKKTGDGHMVYQDGSEYRGHLLDGVKSGRGLYVWPKDGDDQQRCGHTYVG